MRAWIVAAGAAALVVGVLVVVRPAAAKPAPRTWRNDVLDCARQHVEASTPYQWGGGHGGAGYGLDCSGLVIQCARQAGITVAMNADAMYKQLPAVDVPEPGDLALYGKPSRATHVRIVEAFDPSTGIAACIGAENGDMDVTSPEVALERGALVKRVSSHLNRADFLGFRTLAREAPLRAPGPVEFTAWSPPG